MTLSIGHNLGWWYTQVHCRLSCIDCRLQVTALDDSIPKKIIELEIKGLSVKCRDVRVNVQKYISRCLLSFKELPLSLDQIEHTK